jgi:hypothetical protein
MRLLNSDLRWYRDRLIALSACSLVAFSLAFGLLPRSASAHVIPQGGVQVNCEAATVTVTVSSWSGDVEITRTSPLPVKVTDKAPVLVSGAGSATFTVAEIGGNGSYTAGRQGFPTDPTPVPFTVDCAKAQPSIVTTPSGGGSVVGTSINDLATVSGGSSPTGDVTFNLYAPGDTGCAHALTLPDPTETLSGGAATSDSYTTLSAGTYRWTATYNGDLNNNKATSGCDAETVVINPASPEIVTTPSGGGSVVGTSINDLATVSGGSSPTGDVTFNLYAPGDTGCAHALTLPDPTETLSGGAATSDSYTTLSAGTYRWTATYNGDLNNNKATSGCDAETVVINPASGTIATVAAGANLVAGTAGVVSDQASFSGAFNPTGNVVFTLYNSDCSQSTGITGSGAISNAGTASFSSAWTPAAAGTYNWKATYAGDANNAAFATGCHDPNEQVTVAAAPASGTQGASTGASTGGIKAATTNQPNTGQSDFARNMFLALVMVLLGITAFAGQAVFTSMRKEEQ